MGTNNNEVPTARFRAAKACKRCNQRRIKCDALEKGVPCTRCVQNNHGDCVLLNSRRGTYPRKKARIADSRNIPTPEDVVAALSSGSLDLGTSTHAVEATSPCKNASKQNCGSQDVVRGNENAILPPYPPAQTSLGQEPVTSAQPAATACSDLYSPESTFTSNSNTSSYCETSWAAMIERFLDDRKHDPKDMVDKCSITYLGESFPLSIVLGDLKEGGKPRLHLPGPPIEELSTREEPLNDQPHPLHVLPEDITYLEAKQVFEYPPSEILNALISTFLDRYWPIYPIVLRQELVQQHKDQSMPWILLHSICFVSATYCPTSILHRAGFSSRKEARFAYYRKAKALFDTGYERNKIAILQSVIMLTFWGGGPNNHWNFYSWIGTGVTIAETLGMHRSLDGTNMKPQDKSLLKRLWWTLLIRDASCGALVGRPFRINMDHCDTEMLTESDFEHDLLSPEFATHPQRRTFSLYQIHMTKLSLILRDIVATRFDPGKKRAIATNLNDVLQNWRQQLPPELKWTETSTNMDIFASCLCIQYNHHLILAHLGTLTPGTANFMGHSSVGDSPSMGMRQTSESAAHRISTLACSIATRSQVLLMTHEAFQGLFLAMVVFYTQMKSPQPLFAQLGRTALSNCQLVLHEARESWDPSPWIMKLFDNLINHLEEEAPNSGIGILADDLGIDYHFGGSMMNLFDTAMPINASLDNWQVHPTLGNIFNTGTGGGGFQALEYPMLS